MIEIYKGSTEHSDVSVFVNNGEVSISYDMHCGVDWTDVYSLVDNSGFQMHHNIICSGTKKPGDIDYLRAKTRENALREIICKIIAGCENPPSNERFPGNL